VNLSRSVSTCTSLDVCGADEISACEGEQGGENLADRWKSATAPHSAHGETMNIPPLAVATAIVALVAGGSAVLAPYAPAALPNPQPVAVKPAPSANAPQPAAV
jgi:hypothetical protein